MGMQVQQKAIPELQIVAMAMPIITRIETGFEMELVTGRSTTFGEA